MLTSLGTPARDAVVDVWAYPANQSGSIVALSPLGNATTDAAGTFELNTGVAPPVGTLGRDGTVALLFTTATPAGWAMSQLDAIPPSKDAPVWTFDQRTSSSGLGGVLASDVGYLTLNPLGTASGQSASASSAGADDLADPSELDSGLDGTGAAPTVPALTGLDLRASYDIPCHAPNGNLEWRDTGDLTTRLIPVQRARTRANSTVTYSWDTTTSTTAEIAVTGQYGNGSGGYSHSIQETTSAGAVGTVSNGRSVMVKAKWQYKKQQAVCVVTWHSGVDRVPLEEYRWVPVKWTGGFAPIDVSENWSCPTATDTTINIAGTLWVARSTDVTYAQWFQIGGVKLGSHQTNGTNRKLEYTADTGKVATLCGKDNYPIDSSQVNCG